MIRNFMFTSESVTEGHPDKVCDQIGDAIVDHFLAQDPTARIQAECALSGAILFIAARFASKANVDFARLARKVIQRIGYDQPEFNPRSCSILTSPRALSVDVSDCFDEDQLDDAAIDRIAARNQVTVFGFACRQTPCLMPLPIWLAHRIARQLTQMRRGRDGKFLMPDGRVQVGVIFRDRMPQRIHSITIQIHQAEQGFLDATALKYKLLDAVIAPVFDKLSIKPDQDTRIFVNPDGIFYGGPIHHSGLTGRKNAIDTYGEFARHSGKALSGKDPLRVDRTGAYAARYAAKNIVAAGLAEECEVMLSYSSGLTRPVSMLAQTFGTGCLTDDRITRLLHEHFDFRPAAMLRQFRLRHLPARSPKGFFQHLAAYGHFGRDDLDLPWEQTDKADQLRSTTGS